MGVILNGHDGGRGYHHHPVGNRRSGASSSVNDHIVAKGTAQNVNSTKVKHYGAMLHLGRVNDQVCLAFADVPRNIGATPLLYCRSTKVFKMFSPRGRSP